MASSDDATPDTAAISHSGTGPVNINSDNGQQINNTISGGFGNIQYNAAHQCFQISGERSLEQLDLEFRQKLFVTDPVIDRINLISAKGERVAETCEWICMTKEYKSWHDEDVERLLWIWGEPSKGKTMLSIFLSQELEKEATSIYFFCSADDDKRNNAVAVLRGLLWHLTKVFPRLTRAVRKSFETNIAAALSSREILWTAFTDLIGAVDCQWLYCVIDGLDECDENSRRWLTSKLISLKSTGDASRVKLVIFSRELLDLRESLQVKLDTDYSENVNWAVEAFLDARSRELFNRIAPKEEYCTHIKATLFEKSEGTFLWIAFAMDELMQQGTMGKVLNVLEDLPAGLAPYYDRMIRNIDSRRREVSLHLLRCVTFASRPLGFMELASVIECTPPTGINPHENIRDLIADCHPLFHIRTGDIVGLVHESVRDYVREGKFPDKIHVSSEETHLRIAQVCLDALGSYDSPLLDYAETFWPHHARMSGMRVKELLTHRSSFFNKNFALRNKWWQSRLKSQEYPDEFFLTPGFRNNMKQVSRCIDPSRLHLACSLGIKPWVDDILRKHHNPFSKRFYLLRQDKLKHTPLIHAVIEGHTQTVEALLHYTSAARTLVNNSDKDNQTSLHWAAYYDQLEIAKLLLHYEAKVNAKEYKGRTALHFAKNVAMTRLLLEHGADANIKDSRGNTALHHAVDVATMTLLLDHGANVNAKDSHQATALHCARDVVTIRLLLERGADVDARDSSGKTALHRAADGRCHETTSKLLLRHGSDVNAKDSDECTALHYAQDVATARLFIEQGANINAKDSYQQTALHRAKDAAMIRLLIEYGVYVDARGNDGRTALHWAAAFCQEAKTKLLLELGADVNARDKSGETVLYSVTGFRLHDGYSERIVKLLLDNGADFNAKYQCETYEETALQSAARNGHAAVVKLLLEAGARRPFWWHNTTEDDSGDV